MPEGWPRIIVHADMDAFYASVEQLDDPGLRGRPVLVGPRSARGVVLTASYEARPYGVGSAMPMAKARRLCPQAMVVPPRFDRYSALSATIMGVFEQFSPTVEALSLDEAFIDMSGAERIFGGPTSMAKQLQAAVQEVTGGLTVSVGVAASKYVAKVASAYAKPNGLTVVPREQAVAWLAPMSVAKLWGAGTKTQQRLHALGYHTIGDIAAADPNVLRSQLGSAGTHFYELAHARDPRPVESRRQARSMSAERTLTDDVRHVADIEAHLRRSADRIARRLRRNGVVAGGVRVRLKTADFRLLTRQCMLATPTDTADALFAAARKLLRRFDDAGPFRLVGLVAHALTRRGEPAQLSLLDERADVRNLEITLDRLAERYGANAVTRARDVSDTVISDTAPTMDFTLRR